MIKKQNFIQIQKQKDLYIIYGWYKRNKDLLVFYVR